MDECPFRVRDGHDGQQQIAARRHAHALTAFDRYLTTHAPLLAMNARPAFRFQIVECDTDAADQLWSAKIRIEPLGLTTMVKAMA